MTTLSSRDNERLHQLLQQLYATRDLDEFPRVVLQLLPQLVASDMTSYNEVSLKEGRIVGLAAPLPFNTIEELSEKLAPLLSEHPLIAHFAQTQDGSPSAISDLLSRRTWHKTAIYNEFFRPLGIEDQLAIGLKDEAPWIFGIALNRSNCSFSARDRLILELLRPHLAQAHANAVAWTRLQHHQNEQGIAVRESAPQLGQAPNRVLVVRDNGQIVFCGARSQQLLQRYFGVVKRRAPDMICQWLAASDAPNVARHQALSAASNFAPLRIMRAHQTLVVRCGERSEGQTLLWLEEETQIANAPLDSLLQSLMTRGLTRRQSEVLLHLSRGQSNEQIALHLEVSLHTVKRHLEAIYTRMDVNGRGAASHLARQWLQRETDFFD